MALDKNKVTQLTFINKLLLDELELLMLEEFWFKGADGDRVQAFLLKPPGFDARKKYPLVLAIHGGPQNMWADRFMTTWFTFQLITSPGYVGLFINPRGSTGYGSKFREQVSHDYGGRAYEDLMSGLDYAIKQYDFIDPLKTAAIGGSYGGYCVNWILGHTDRFKCLVSHAGLYNLESFYGSTDELWYPAWDIGKTPWDVLTNYPDREIFIEGHTDNVPIAQKFEGKYKSNWELSTSRALSVLHYVRQHPKASPYRLRVVGYGEQKPIADNSTEEGRIPNRRVEIVIGAKLK